MKISENSAKNVTRIEGTDVLAQVLRSAGVATGQRYGLLLRDSRVLCALPADRETALKTLALYQPQRWKAKLLKVAFKGAATLHLHLRFLKAWTTPDGFGSHGSPPPGIMIGSPGHLCDRAVTVQKGTKGWLVSKLAFGQNGGSILSNEVAMLQNLASQPWVPHLVSYDENEQVAQLCMEWQDGASWNDDDLRPLLDLLSQWLDRAPLRRLSDFPEWGWIAPVLERRPEWKTRISQLSETRVCPAIRHGDLTRPNLRVAADGSLIVHDWERGSMEGIPGLDLVHFLITDGLFRTRKSPAEVVAHVRNVLDQPAASSWLETVGWASQTESLMALSFALNTGAGYIDQEALFGCLAQTSKP